MTGSVRQNYFSHLLVLAAVYHPFNATEIFSSILIFKPTGNNSHLNCYFYCLIYLPTFSFHYPFAVCSLVEMENCFPHAQQRLADVATNSKTQMGLEKFLSVSVKSFIVSAIYL